MGQIPAETAPSPGEAGKDPNQSLGGFPSREAPQRGVKTSPGPGSNEERGADPSVKLIPGAIAFVIRAILYFLAGRIIWLTTQFVGEYFLKDLLTSNVKKPAPRVNPAPGLAAEKADRAFPTQLLLKRIDQIPLGFLIHPFQRLRMVLSNPQGALSSEDLNERERRIVETDSEILWGSWTPFRWLVWTLPFLGLVQSSWLLYRQLLPVLTGTRDIQHAFSAMALCSVPLVQVIVVTIVLRLAFGLMGRLEDLYLSNLDALLYDRFLCRLPYQSSDTVVLLETFQRHFQELHRVLRRVETALANQKNPPE